MPTIDFIPPSLFAPLFQWALFALVVVMSSQYASGHIYLNRVCNNMSQICMVFLLILLIGVGCRPISYYFGDTINYAAAFNIASKRGVTDWLETFFSFKGEFLFNSINHFCIQYADIHLLFFIFGIIYIGGQYLFTRRLLGNYWFTAMLAMACMIDYWGFAINGIRNGAASSVMLLALSYKNKPVVAFVLALLSLGLHKSMMLLAAAALLAHVYKNSRVYFLGWLACIALSLVAGQTISNLLSHSFLSDLDSRLASYNAYAQDLQMMKQFSSIGFRPDFLLYSLIPVAVGHWYLSVRKVWDETYRWWLNIYIIANSFWVLNMYSFSSNRFAVLSWFLAGVILMYPFFNKRSVHSPFIKSQGLYASRVLLAWYAFDFYIRIVKTTI